MTAPAPEAPPTIARRHTAARWLGLLLTALVVLALLLAGLLAWVLHTPAGTRTALGLVPGVHIVSPSGTLWGDFAAARVEVALGDGGALVLERPRWRQLRLVRDTSAPWGLQLAVEELATDTVTVRPSPPPAGEQPPPTPPQELVSPIGVDVARLRVGTLNLPGLAAPIRDLQAGVRLAGGAGTHRIDGLQLDWDRLRLAASARIGSQAPLPLQASASLAEAPGASAPSTAAAAPPWSGWQAQVEVDGELERFAATATLRSQQQRLNARAQVTPFGALPVGEVDADAEALNLAALVSGAPRTALSGTLRARLARPPAGTAPGMPLELSADIGNSAAGAWDEGLLPVTRLQAQAAGDASRPEQGQLRRFRVDVGTAARPGGSLTGRGAWDGARWTVDATIDSLRPAALDARAPDVVLGGPLALRGSGGLPGPAAPAPLQVDAEGRLQARWAGAPPPGAPPGPWQFDLAGQGNASGVTLRRFDVRGPVGHASLSGSARRTTARPSGWQLRGELALENVDPLVLPAVAQALPGGPTRLNGGARFDLLWPEAQTAGTATTPGLAALRGRADAELHDSQVAGLPLAGGLSLVADDAQGRVAVKASLDAAGNQARVDGSLDARSTATPSDQWQVEVEAPALARLEPVLRVLAPGFALQGNLRARAEVAGRWPSLTTRGELSTDELHLPGSRIDEARASWNVGTHASDPMDVQLQAARIELAGQHLATSRLTVAGDGRDHRIALSFEAAPPPPAGGAPAPQPDPRRLLARLQARGGWTAPPTGDAIGWRGKVQALELLGARSDTVGSTAGPGAVWLSAAPFDVDWSRSSSGARQQLEIGATQVRVLDAVLRLSELAWAQDAGATRLDAAAALEPLAVAPLLDRLQPGFGWGGDLRVGGEVALHSDATSGFRADVQLQRISGDLNVTDPGMLPAPVNAAPLAAAASGVPGDTAPVRGITQRLGLRDARLALSARDGIWRFTQQLSGRGFGRITGEQTVRTHPQSVWPAADAPVQGALEIQVDNLGTWGRWAPAGWRLVGEMAMQARVGGRFRAPEFTGRLTGNGIGARNLLLGVDVRDGEIAVALDGASARIERFVLHGEQGTVRAEGKAELGAEPQAHLDVVAEGFAALIRVDRRVVISGRTQLDLRRDAVRLRGGLTVDEASIDVSTGGAPTLGDDVSVVGRDKPEEGPASAAAPRRQIDLRLTADLGEQFRLRGRGINTLLRGSLLVTAPGGKPAIEGTIRTVEGSYNAYAQSLTIQRGTIAFSGPPDNPRLDILALRTQSPRARETDVKVGVAITGPAQDPRVRLYSEPEMSETEKLSWLVLGRGPNDLGRTEMALLQQGALALLAGEGDSSGGTGGVLQRIGLDELSVSRGEGTVRDTIVTVGKQISDRWFVGYEHSLTATTGTWQLIYRVAQRFTLRAQSGLENAFDVIWTWRWD